jgi:hypothetical protein
MKKNIWHPVENHSDILVGQYIVPNFISNSIAIKASPSDIVVISPGQPLLENCPKEWLETGVTLHLVMPNSFHYMGVAAWCKAFPQHKLYASKGAIKRLSKVANLDSSQKLIALESQQPPLPFEYSFLFPPGHRGHDVWLKKFNKSSNTSLWITCDSFLNYDRMSNQPIAKAMQRMLDAAPGLKMSQVIKWFILDDKTKFKAWALAQIRNDQPFTLIPSHGEIAHSENLPEQLSTLLEGRL